MIVNYNDYKDGVPGADGLELKRQNLTWSLPYHDGAVRAFKEAGVWTDAAQKHQDMMVRRQQVLMTAWDEFLKSKPADEKDAFYSAWMAKRKDALVKAGLDPIF
jgi:hypothetical protein